MEKIKEKLKNMNKYQLKEIIIKDNEIKKLDIGIRCVIMENLENLMNDNEFDNFIESMI